MTSRHGSLATKKETKTNRPLGRRLEQAMRLITPLKPPTKQSKTQRHFGPQLNEATSKSNSYCHMGPVPTIFHKKMFM